MMFITYKIRDHGRINLFEIGLLYQKCHGITDTEISTYVQVVIVVDQHLLKKSDSAPFIVLNRGHCV